MKKLFICTCALFLFAAGFNSCDSTSAPGNALKETPILKSFRVIPDSVNFAPEDGFTDTTLVFSIEANISYSGDELNNPYAIIFDKNDGTIIAELDLKLADSRTGLYAADFPIFTTTTSFEEYKVSLIYDEEMESYAQTNLQVRGFSNAPPELISADNPRTTSRPSSGTKPISFTAKVTDADGQATIKGVYLDLISQVTGAVNQFELFDDGTSGNDAVANDSTFTVTLEIDPTRQLQSYDIHYFAIDKGGLISDTVKTTFSIVE